MDVIQALGALEDTSIPTILAAGGLFFILLAFVGRISGRIELPPGRQKWAALIGILLLFSGTALDVLPAFVPDSSPTPTTAISGTSASISAAPTDTPSPASTATYTPELTDTDVRPPTPTPKAQEVCWGPAFYGLEAGVCINDPRIPVCSNGCDEFVPWDEFKRELEQKLLPRVEGISKQSTVALQDYGEKRDWVVKVNGTDGAEEVNIWLGPDPDNDWEPDGLIRVGIPPGRVWVIFQRYSDGSFKEVFD